MSDEMKAPEEAWTTIRLRDALVERGAQLRTPAEHRDEWLSAIVERRRAVFLVALRSGSTLPSEHVQEALDTAAGVLMELPRLEEDAWRGWKDPGLRRMLLVLRMAELPEEPPRAALDSVWRQLRAAVPLELPTPRVGEPPDTFELFSAAIVPYLVRLEAEVGRTECEEVTEREPSRAETSIPRHLLAERLRRSVDHHVARVRRYVMPLAADQWAESFAAQRSGTALNRLRGDHERLEEGRALRMRSKHRYHLAAWILKQTGLSRADIGLFLHCIDPVGLLTALPETNDAAGRAALEKEIDNALAFWTYDSRGIGDPPFVQLGQIEWELHDLLRPVRG